MKNKKALLGYDIGTSSIKAALIDAETGELITSAFSPEVEMKISSPYPDWAEQHPDTWWHHVVLSTKKLLQENSTLDYDIAGIGISYQMHGLVVVDKYKKAIYPSIIWCDSRAVEIGDKAFNDLGTEFCLIRYLNSPGNFTASKIKWLKENRPDIYENVYKIMLPGDYIALKLTGVINTTISGLSEGIFWDFKNNVIAEDLMRNYGLDKNILADIVPTFSDQGRVSEEAAKELGIKQGIPVAYRAGDQPNNAFSLNVLNPGEIAATAGTSGVVYGITEENAYDLQSRVNGFAHVNYTDDKPLKGILLCINGVGITNSWLKGVLGSEMTYTEMNQMGQKIKIGSEGLAVLPFGNGAERIFANKNIGGSVSGLNFNIHGKAHLARAVQEGIAFAFRYGVDIMKEMGMKLNIVKAGNANMFLSPLFCEAISNICGVQIDIYNTDGATGAARGAGIGAGIYNSFEKPFNNLKKVKEIFPDPKLQDRYEEAYVNWNKELNGKLLST